MNKDKFFELVENPLIMSQYDVSDLKELVEDYPYFHTAHLLLLKGLHQENSLKFDHQLQKSAINIPDRRKLYRLLFYANHLFESKLGTKEEIRAEENLIEVITDPDTLKVKEDSIELLHFNFEEKEKKETEDFDKKDDLLEYEYSSDYSNTLLSPDYFSAYHIEDNEPIDEVYLNSFYTFDEWLKMLKNKKASTLPDIKIESKKKENHQFELIDNFIKESPRIQPSKDEVKEIKTKNEESLKEKSDFITETLANIYVKQGHYDKAISAYQKLSLKYPEKNSYFADQIQKLERIIKEQ